MIFSNLFLYFCRLYNTGGKNMKNYILRIIVTSTLLSTSTNPVLDSVNYSPNECEQLAGAIITGARPPLSDDEMNQLDPETVNRLAGCLKAKHSNLTAVISSSDSGEQPQTREPNQIKQVKEHQEENTNGPVARQPLSKNEQDFINLIAPDAQKIAQEHDLFASVMIAQAILESDWGRSDLARTHYNLFGIKGSYHGQSTTMPTQEHRMGCDLTEQHVFRKYPSVMESLQDYAMVLDQEIYEQVHKRHCLDYQTATRALNQKYATDPRYHQKLDHLIQAYDLTKYDQIPEKKEQFKNSQPIDEKHKVTAKQPVRRQKTTKRKGIIIPLIGGISSVGVVELFKRWVK